LHGGRSDLVTRKSSAILAISGRTRKGGVHVRQSNHKKKDRSTEKHHKTVQARYPAMLFTSSIGGILGSVGKKKRTLEE